MINVETYGSGLWTTWFDRDLSVAGRVLVRQEDGQLVHKLVSPLRIIWRQERKPHTHSCASC